MSMLGNLKEHSNIEQHGIEMKNEKLNKSYVHQIEEEKNDETEACKTKT